MMKLIYLLFLPFLLSGTIEPEERQAWCKNSLHILEQSKLRHDPQREWEKLALSLHIQEPRIQTPERYSKIKINNREEMFEIERTREEGRMKSMVDKNGNFSTLLNDEVAPEAIISKYGLNKERNMMYWSFYKTMIGLPMSLTEDSYLKLDTAEVVRFEAITVYRIDLELKESIIRKNWSLMISPDTYELLAIELKSDNPAEDSEVIKFEGEFATGGMRIPRIRHWYSKESATYLGSDIIVKEL